MWLGRIVRIAIAIVGGMLLLPFVAGPAGAAPAITVTPDEDLVDFQEVTVSGSGYTPGATIGLVQCLNDPGSQENCDLSTLTYTSANSTGSFTAQFEVQRLLDVQGEEVDCAPGACGIGAGNISDFDEASATPIEFDPTVPPAPRLNIDVAVDKRGSFTRAGDAVVDGVVTCNLPATVYVEGFVEQRVGRTIISGSFFSMIECDGTTPWTATTEFTNGVFRGGPLQVEAFAYGDTGSMFDDDAANSTVKLTGKRR